jgi:hypothetical protein
MTAAPSQPTPCIFLRAYSHTRIAITVPKGILTTLKIQKIIAPISAVTKAPVIDSAFCFPGKIFSASQTAMADTIHPRIKLIDKINYCSHGHSKIYSDKSF